LNKAAADAGADVAIVITPGYFQFALPKAGVKQFFIDVAAASPIPVMMYNFPGASGGIDIDSELVVEIAREAPNICGIKLTCGAVGKLTRICADTATDKFAQYKRQSASAPTFVTLGGFADFLLPTVAASRAHGAIMGLGNIFPRALNHLMELSLKLAENPDKQTLQKAQALQDLASATDLAFVKAGISGTKWFLQKHHGYPSARMRRPLLDYDAKKGEELERDPDVVAFLEIEKSLS
jgi:L-threo-3-deoxy-hexylosonate aldolase